ncbi:MAG: hypothetical protein ABI628_12690 [Chloroflexota bacterium]
MTPARHERADPMVGTERLLIDGSNLLHALGRARGGPAPAATLVGRLRAVIPAAVRIELILDGAPDPGLRGTRIASGLTVRHSGSASADWLIERLVVDAIGSGGTPETAHAVADAILVVTDDIDLGQRVRRRGSRSAGTPWLTKRLDRGVLSAPSAGTPRPARPTRPTNQARTSDDDDDRGRWQPGRGATRKSGNPKRGRPPDLPR